jgi:hypothetical protein
MEYTSTDDAYREGALAYEAGAPLDVGPYSDIDWDYRSEHETAILRAWREGWHAAKQEWDEYLEPYYEDAPDTYDETFGL